METIENWHGTRNGYSYHRCRCEPCVEAKRRYDRERYWKERGRDAPPPRRPYKFRPKPRVARGEIVPAEPFRMWLAQRVQEYSVSNVAATLGISQRRVRTIIDGYYWQRGKKYPVKNLTLDFVDNALVAFGDHLMDLYPDLY